MTYGLLHVLTAGCGLICSLNFYPGIFNDNELMESYHILLRPLSLFLLSSALRPDAVNDLFNHIIVFIIKGGADIRDVLDKQSNLRDI
jgi:hypothetical protein